MFLRVFEWLMGVLIGKNIWLLIYICIEMW